MRDWTIPVGAVALVIIFCISAAVGATICHNQWARSGLNSEWRMFSGCMVQRKDGTWLPADKIREVQP